MGERRNDYLCFKTVSENSLANSRPVFASVGRLYHGSRVPGLVLLRPFPHHIVGGEAVVFATEDIRFAIAMIHGTGNELSVTYNENKNTGRRQLFVDELRPGRLRLLEQPGYLYEISMEGFEPDVRLLPEELVAKHAVQVLSEITIGDVRTELENLGAQLVPYDLVQASLAMRGKKTIEPQVEYAPSRFEPA